MFILYQMQEKFSCDDAVIVTVRFACAVSYVKQGLALTHSLRRACHIR